MVVGNDQLISGAEGFVESREIKEPRNQEVKLNRRFLISAWQQVDIELEVHHRAPDGSFQIQSY